MLLHLKRSLASAALAVALVACVGGAGSVTADADGYDERAGTRESPGSTSEAPVSSADRRAESDPRATEGGGSGAAGAQPGDATAFACSGSYRCTIVSDGKPSTSTVSLSRRDGTCTVVDEDQDEVVLASDGTIMSNGQTGGSWAASGAGFTVTVGSVTGVCVPAS